MLEGYKILIVEGRFYENISDELCKGAIEVLDEAEMEYERIAVPGAFEIPQAIRLAIHSMDNGSSMDLYAGFIGFGCVIRGETSHYDYVCQEATRALMDIVLQYRIALGYGILTVENSDQAWERADINKKNKGGDVAHACLRMMEVKKYFHPLPR
jgi:6,7-dimethyl-8-ribityllumazine synthase